MTEVVVDGHAGYGKCGQDIVCAAISTLIYGLYASLNELTEDITYIEEDEPFRFKIPLNHSKEAGLLMQSFLVQARMVERFYPGNVRVIHD